jgi:hypothetical protein
MRTNLISLLAHRAAYWRTQLALLRFFGTGMATSARRAEFTASAVSKTAATSGSSTTSVVVRPIRPAYLPRTDFENSDAARIASLAGLRLVFFISVFLALGRELCSSGSGLLLIQILLKAREHLADLIRPSEIGDRVGDGVVIFQPQ